MKVQLQRPLLFDLQALLSWAGADVPAAVVRRVKEGYMVYVSIVSAWEFILKEQRYKFNIEYGQLLETIERLQGELLPIKQSHLDKLKGMPVIERHHDPFDRLLVAQALEEDFILVGGDEMFARYSKAFALKVLWN
jgi:PIN domain nuclease of toxin-antitoxin system